MKQADQETLLYPYVRQDVHFKINHPNNYSPLDPEDTQTQMEGQTISNRRFRSGSAKANRAFAK